MGEASWNADSEGRVRLTDTERFRLRDRSELERMERELRHYLDSARARRVRDLDARLSEVEREAERQAREAAARRVPWKTVLALTLVEAWLVVGALVVADARGRLLVAEAGIVHGGAAALDRPDAGPDGVNLP